MDTKLKQISIITTFLILSIVNVAKSQQYKLQSLNGDEIQFQLSKNDNQHVLSIAYSTDTVYVRDVGDVKEVTPLNNNFLSIVYGVRAGTGMTATRTLLLSVSNNKINQSLNLTSLFHDDFLDFNNYVSSPMKVEVKSVYTVTLSLTGNSISNYKIVSKIHDERSSVHSPKTNYNNNFVSTREFDKDQNVFCNLHEQISGYFTIWDPKIQKRIRQYIKGNFAVAKLGNYKYYFINRSWYRLTDKNYMTKYTYN
jgi:aspartate carbamoyltransferase regulatory subunit